MILVQILKSKRQNHLQNLKPELTINTSPYLKCWNVGFGHLMLSPNEDENIGADLEHSKSSECGAAGGSESLSVQYGSQTRVTCSEWSANDR